MRIGVPEHPEEVLEEDHLASDGQALAGGGLVCEHSEEGVVDELGADEVAAAGFAHVDGLEGVVVAAGGGRGAEIGGRRRGRGRGRLPFLEHGFEGQLSSFCH